MIAPPYASMVVVELLDRAGLVVRVSYKNDSSENPYVLTIPGCDQLCPLSKFKDLTYSVRPGDWREECGLRTADNTIAGVGVRCSNMNYDGLHRAGCHPVHLVLQEEWGW